MRCYLSEDTDKHGTPLFYIRIVTDRGTKTLNLQKTAPGGRLSRAEAEEKLQAQREALGLDPTAVGIKEDAADALHKFQTSLRAQRAPIGTYDYYDWTLRYIMQALAPRPMWRWEPSDLERLILANPQWKAKRSVEKVLQVARRFIRFCEEREIRCADFAKGIKARGLPTRETATRTAEQIRAVFVAAKGHPLEPLLALAVFADLREGSILTMRWEDIDFVNALVLPPAKKTGHGKPIPMCPEGMEILERHRATSGRICRDLGESPGAVRDYLYRLERAAWGSGAPRCGWRSFRHSAATIARKEGRPLAEIARMLQHRHGSAITARYDHADDEGVRETANVVGRAILG